jgi:putative ABC transport system ATP-binding protein
MTEILQMEHVTKTYRPHGRGEVVALQDLSLTLERGSFQVVCGQSGSGKSTLLLTAGGLQKPETGTVHVQGTDLYRLSSEQRAQFRAARIGFVFQQFHLIPFLNVLENVMAPALALRTNQTEMKARDLIALFGLDHRLDHPPSELSTGERQRVALARAMLHEPAMVLADEPTGNLDEINAGAVLRYLRDFANRGGAVLMATHNTGIEADKKYMLAEGRLLQRCEQRV